MFICVRWKDAWPWSTDTCSHTSYSLHKSLKHPEPSFPLKSLHCKSIMPPCIWCQTSTWNTVKQAFEWQNEKKKFLTNALSPHMHFIHSRGLWIFISCNIYTKLAYLFMKYFPLLVNSSKIDQLSKERETLKVTLPDAWNKTKPSQKGRSDSTQSHTIT